MDLNREEPMDEDDVRLLDDFVWTSIAQDCCANTVRGWVWYCDAHNTHGNADSEAEALAVSEAHDDFFRDEECDIWVVLVRREGSERSGATPQ